MIPRLGESPARRVRFQQRTGVYAVLPLGREVLLTFQGTPHNEIQLPGGGVDEGEHLIPALHREVMEETGWKISAPRQIGIFRRFVYMPEYDLWAEKLCHIYLARPVLQVSEPLEVDHEALWSPLTDAFRLPINPIDVSVLRKFADQVR